MPHANQRPELQRVDFDDTVAIIEAIKKDGGVIAKNYTSLEDLEKVNAETKPYLDADKPWKGALFPPETRRCTRLIGRSETAREKWLVNQRLTEVLNYFVTKTTKNYYDQKQHTYTTYPVLSVSITMDVRPGAKGQRFHRDDKVHHVDHEDMTQTGYQREADISMAVLVPGCKTTIENGATLVIPGSHLWGDNRAPLLEECGYATMEPGEALIFLGSTYHAGGTNATTDTNRPVHGMFFCRGTHRAEENQYLAYSASEVLKWSKEAQIRAGYNCSSPNLGFVDFYMPIQFLSGKMESDNMDLDGSDMQLLSQKAF
ncbi:MAG: hypothetical protein M1834_008944 [Cirrosporium novae-zelandiae]|nr:MAG: hypothetical protein M1834_008944 [Cirrosporium novae-zelandiae]